MTGRRVLPLLVGLWAYSAFGQTPTFKAYATIQLDGGTSFARAYVATSGSNQYALVNAGQTIQVFDVNGVEKPLLEPQPGSTFSSFALVNGVANGTGTTTTIVAVGDVTAPACATTMCLSIYAWSDAQGFQLLNTTTTTVLSASAMAIDTSVSPFNVYYASASPTTLLFQQQVTVSASDAGVTFPIVVFRSLPAAINTVVGMAVDAPSASVYLTDNQSILYRFAADIANNADGGVFATPATGNYGQIQGLSLFGSGATTGLLAGGVGTGVYELDPFTSLPANIVTGIFVVQATDGGGTKPSSASYLSKTFAVLTEDSTASSGAFLHLVDAGPPPVPDAGTPDGGGGGGADAGGIPTLPSVQPGPGAPPAPGNSCACSTAGDAPLLLVLLLPLLAPRRRRL